MGERAPEAALELASYVLGWENGLNETANGRGMPESLHDHKRDAAIRRWLSIDAAQTRPDAARNPENQNAAGVSIRRR